MTAFATYPPQGMSTRTRWQAFGMAAAIETAIVVAVLAGAARHVQRDEPVVLSINLTPTTPPVAPPAPPKPDIPPPRAKAAPAPAAPAARAAAPAPPTPAVTPPQPAVHNVEAPQVAAPVAPPPPPAASAVLSAEYVAKVKAAVQGATAYPMAAKAQDFKGRARVAFSLNGTRPSGARIEVTSGMSICDKAALKAVEEAVYPPAPEAFSHADQAFEVWVSFGA